MRLLPSGAVQFSATDLTNHLACEHLTAQRRGIALGERPRPRPHEDPHAELIRRRGEEHEAEQLARFIDEAGGDWVDLRGTEAPATADAMRRGTRLLYQPSFVHGSWHGYPDFLRRVEYALDGYHPVYEVLDTKLSRQVKPHVVHQLCLYNALVAEVQGQLVDHAWVVLGDGRHHRIQTSRFAALHRRAAARLERELSLIHI